MALFLFCPSYSQANQESDRVSCRPELGQARRDELARQLRRITGWNNLAFDEAGVLRLDRSAPVAGSQTARQLLIDAVHGKNLLVLEDAGDTRDVVFCRVVQGRWKAETVNSPPVFIIQIDFADFSRVTGDGPALEAFNAGWGVLHEISHVVHDSEDAGRGGEAGECEELINVMRRESGLAERAEYYFTFLPGAEGYAGATKFVRLAFEQRVTKDKKRRYWLIWDARLVGGLDEQSMAATRGPLLR